MKQFDMAQKDNQIKRLSIPSIVCCTLVAFVISTRGLGLGVFLAVLFLCCAVVVTGQVKMKSGALFFLLAAIILASMAVIRDATWVVVLDLLAALFALAVAVFGGQRGMTFARSLPFVLSRLPAGGMLFLRGFLVHVPNRKRLHFPSVMRAAFLSFALIWVFGNLFFWSDKGFANLIQSGMPSRLPITFWLRILLFLFAGALVGAFVCSTNKGIQREQATKTQENLRRPVLNTLEWAVAITSLNILFVLFVVTQLASFFAGSSHIVKTAGLTYAANAHSGFIQLCIVSVLVLAVVWWANRALRFGEGRSGVVLRIGLTVLCLLTFVVLSSGFHRLHIYEDAFGLTRLRLFVDAFMVWLGVILLFVCISLVRQKWQWLPRTAIGFTLIFGITFSLLNPDGMVAQKNVERFQTTGKVDLQYLQSLSGDALPALSRLPQKERTKVFDGYRKKAINNEIGSWRELNFARSHANTILF